MVKSATSGTPFDTLGADVRRCRLACNTMDEQLTALGRVELRRERGVLAVASRDVDSYLLSASAQYKLNEEQRLVIWSMLPLAMPAGLSNMTG